MLTRVSDPRLALWQSSVSEVVRAEQRESGTNELSQAAILTHPMMKAVNTHVTREHRTRGQLEHDPQASAEESAASLSSLLFHLAEARVGGDSKAIDKLTAELPQGFGTEECRKYATCDLKGWATCMTTYIEYRLKYSEPLYRDWKKLGKDISTYGVISYQLPAKAKVAIIGDWGTGMDDAKALLLDIVHQEPDVIIHVGDIYYSGTPDECQLNFIDIFNQAFSEAGKPRVPVFAIPGNHEYYAFGAGFYPTIDQISAGRESWKQEASYFCLRSEDGNWQFLAMDTGRQDYWPLDDMDPFYDGPGLQESEIAWHHNKLAPDQFAGATILLSHHQLFSQHSKISNLKRKWLNEHLLKIFEAQFSKIACWFWGHEHNLVRYENELLGLAKGRLVGCSGYEESTGENPYKPHSPEFEENVPYQKPLVQVGSTPSGYFAHGYAMIQLDTPSATVTYHEFPSWGKEHPVGTPKSKIIGSETITKPDTPVPPTGKIVNFDDRFYLRHSQGDSVVAFYKGVQYYPRLGSTGAVRFELKGGVGQLTNGAEFQVKSTEESLGKYDYLGAWTLTKDLYYYIKGYDQKKETWKLSKKTNVDDKFVRYGDQVYITSVAFAGQRMAKDGEYITTSKDASDFWILMETSPVAEASGLESSSEPRPDEAAAEMPSPAT